MNLHVWHGRLCNNSKTHAWQDVNKGSFVIAFGIRPTFFSYCMIAKGRWPIIICILLAKRSNGVNVLIFFQILAKYSLIDLIFLNSSLSISIVPFGISNMLGDTHSSKKSLGRISIFFDPRTLTLTIPSFRSSSLSKIFLILFYFI